MKKLKGYIFSRSFMGERVPQHVQNLVIRDYCNKNKFQYLLSATEYAMEGCHLILEQLIQEISSMDGIALYSMYQLPEESNKRKEIYNKITISEKSLHFCVEGPSLFNQDSIHRVENSWKVKTVLPNCYLNSY
jgi:sporadic carbohydrate cluster protein (TIGR04323 family)